MTCNARFGEQQKPQASWRSARQGIPSKEKGEGGAGANCYHLKGISQGSAGRGKRDAYALTNQCQADPAPCSSPTTVRVTRKAGAKRAFTCSALKPRLVPRQSRGSQE